MLKSEYFVEEDLTMAEVSVLVGAQWGDEGKGKWSDHLSRDANVVARFQGGNNAGHTIYVDGEKLVLHQVPCGFGNNDQILALTAGVVVNPGELWKEVSLLSERLSPDIAKRVMVSWNSFVITPWHIHLDKKSEESSPNPIGTTKRGIGPTYQDRVSRLGMKFYEYLSPKYREAWVNKMRRASDEFAVYFEGNKEAWEEFFCASSHLSAFAGNVETLLREMILRTNKKIFLEGAQGVLLDVNHGTYPYVTSSSTIAAGAACSIGFDPRLITKIYGVAKAYITRVGGGSFPSEDLGEEGKLLGDKGQEYGATTGRRRRCGWFDAVAMRYAQDINGFDSILLNKLDILSGFKTLKIATAYKDQSGKIVKEFSNRFHDLTFMEAQYEEFEGWEENISNVKRFAELPEKAQTYIKAIEELSSVKVEYIGNGPNKDDFVTC